MAERPPKPVRWVGRSKADVSAFPEDVKSRVGGALWDAQLGGKTPYAKPLKGFAGAGVLTLTAIPIAPSAPCVSRASSTCCLPEEVEAGHSDAEG